MNNLIKKDLEYRMISRRSNNKEKTMNSMLIHSALALLASAFMVACSGPTEKVERFVYDEKAIQIKIPSKTYSKNWTTSVQCKPIYGVLLQ